MAELQTPLFTERIYKVHELLGEVKSRLETEYGDVQVEGEISAFTRAGSGHCYFNLKDAQAQVAAVLFKWQDRFLRFTPGNGQRVIARGQLSLYEARGGFQLIVRTMRPAGEGELMRRFLELKQRLEAEGLFNPSRKRPIPYLPRCVGVVTSEYGAAWHDIRTVVARRFPNLPLILAPCRVQGAGAAQEIAQAIGLQNALGRADVLVVGRGGGSMEDLWAFNEEPVVRAVVASRIPVISSVGHETDVTLCDFAADLRAPTPSAAAELAAPERAALDHELERRRRRLMGILRSAGRRERARLKQIYWRLWRRPPWEGPAQRLDEAFREAVDSIRQRIRLVVHRMNELEKRLLAAEPRRALAAKAQALGRAEWRLKEAARSRQQRAFHRLEIARVRLGDLGPQPVLERGYSLVQRENGRLVKNAAELTANEPIRITFARGRRGARVD